MLLWVWASVWSRTVSPFYGFTVAFIIIALALSCYFTRQARKAILEEMHSKIGTDKRRKKPVGDELEYPEDVESPEALQSRMKMARHQAIINHLSKNMTEEQLMEEKKIEKAQLTAILNLLKEQKDMFQVSDMQQVEQQLSLYR
ncbi:uncharacterized protein LOC143913285 [Arctopsyche grandis]|uniref:uncharacterized protein LOC143913285 n=1 Tax=Arctopsyche grandis TaxID=121162 RepID=UPI00406D66D6